MSIKNLLNLEGDGRKDMQEENKMGTMAINRLLVTMSVPIIISMLVQALYNVVDSIFVAQISENALNAVSLAFPIQNLMTAVATGTSIGINALLSKNLGKKDFKTANLAAGNGVFLAVCSYAVFALLCGFFAHPYFAIQTDVQEIMDNGVVYIVICGVFSIGTFLQITFERLLQSTGRTMYTMITQTMGAVINLIFDPLLIFGFHMGVMGAAVATVLGQCVACCLAIWFNAKKNLEIRLGLKQLSPNKEIIKKIYSVGVPSIIMSSISSVMIFGLNQILIRFTSTATAVLGVYFKLQNFVFTPVIGLNSGMIPIVAFNFGSQKPKRIMKAIKLSVAYATGIMVLGAIIFHFFGGSLLLLFHATDNMLEIGITALRIINLSFLTAGFGITASSAFQALGHGTLSLIISLARQLIVLLPAAWLLSLSGELSFVWWAFPLSEVASALLCIVFLRYVYGKEIAPLLHSECLSDNEKPLIED